MSDRIEEYRKAKAALHANQEKEIKAGIDHATEEYRELNARVNELEKNVPWWRR